MAGADDEPTHQVKHRYDTHGSQHRLPVPQMTSATLSTQAVIGWDIGGAHLKAARLESGRVVNVVQLPCPLWQGLDELDRAFDAAIERLGPASHHAVTMTGELADVFVGRKAGVRGIADLAASRLGAISLYAGRSGFVPVDRADDFTADIASANWHATAALAARHFGHGLLIDMGSTTTDIIALKDGVPVFAGYSDAERLETGELVYTGALRTSLMVLARHLVFRGRRRGVMAEHFATMADVNRLLGRVNPHIDLYPTADGTGKSLAETRRRLSRLIGEDGLSDVEALDISNQFAEHQLAEIHAAAEAVISRHTLDPASPLILCGTGYDSLEILSQRLGRRTRSISECLPLATSDPRLYRQASNSAPAVAVAALYAANQQL